MGGRGITAGNNGSQMTIDQYLFRQKIKRIQNETERLRNISSHSSLVSNTVSGTGATHKSIPLMRRCACCGAFVIPAFSIYEICPICGWIDDPLQNKNPELAEGENPISLTEARIRWKKKHRE